MEAPRRDGAPPRTVTTVIAERIKTLRNEARLSGPALAAAMNERGIPWNRTTVAKLETGRRETVTVQELLALAVVLDVPPVWLLADPKAGTPVPITEGVEADPWSALLWLIGRQPLAEPTGAVWNDAAAQLGALQQLARWIDAYDQQRDLQAAHDDVAGPSQETLDRRGLTAIQGSLDVFKFRGWPMPPVPVHVRKRAAELGVELPGQEELTP